MQGTRWIKRVTESYLDSLCPRQVTAKQNVPKGLEPKKEYTATSIEKHGQRYYFVIEMEETGATPWGAEHFNTESE